MPSPRGSDVRSATAPHRPDRHSRVGLAGPSPIRLAPQRFLLDMFKSAGALVDMIGGRVAPANGRWPHLEDEPWRIADGHNARAPFGWALAMSRENLPTCGGTAGSSTSRFSVWGWIFATLIPPIS